MKRKNMQKIEDFRPEGILARSISERRYNVADIARITQIRPKIDLDERIEIELPVWWRGDRPERYHVSIRDALAERLEIAAALFFRDDMWAKKPSANKVAGRISQIKSSSGELLRTLGLGTKSRSNPSLIPYSLMSRLALHAGFGRDGTEKVKAAASEIKKLHDWAERELWLMDARAKGEKRANGGVKYAGDTAFNAFLLELGEIWKTVLGGTARVSFIGEGSKHKGKPCGEFFKFIAACLSPLQIEKKLQSDRALGSRLRRLFNQSKGREIPQGK